MLEILFQEKTKKMLVFPKNAEKNASTIEKGLAVLQLYYKKSEKFKSDIHLIEYFAAKSTFT